ncbi:MAG: DUF4422 domain-containing protein [Clostridia bacterium]|nr:DUF4422 domain-containing protein [Clostridia bacterium]
MSMYFITHKEFDAPQEPGYRTLLVGAFRGHTAGDCFDDTGDNISEKNPNYCELTGLYWLWKNSTDDYIGINHYRRYFSRSFSGAQPLPEKEVRRLLDQYDAVLPFPGNTIPKGVSVRQHYCAESGTGRDLDRVRAILKDRCPEYVWAFDVVMASHKMYFFNMLIMKKPLFDEYCAWLFDILFTLEPKLDLTEYNDYQKRVFGFLAERLLNVWVLQKDLNVAEVGVYNTENDWGRAKQILTGLKRVLRYPGFPV